MFRIDCFPCSAKMAFTFSPSSNQLHLRLSQESEVFSLGGGSIHFRRLWVSLSALPHFWCNPAADWRNPLESREPLCVASRGASRYVGISSRHRVGHSPSGVFAGTHYHHRREREGRCTVSFVRPCLPQPAQQLYPAPNGLARGRPDGEHSVAGATV